MANQLDIIITAKDEASNVMRQVVENMRGIGTTAGMTRGQVVDAFKDVRGEVRMNYSAMRTLGQEFRLENQSAFLFGDALSRTGTILSRLTSAYSQFNIQQIRSQQAAAEVSTAQDRVNQAIAQYGSSSQQAITATQALNIAQQNLMQVQRQNTVANVGLVSQLGLQLPTAIMSSAQAWSSYIGYMGGATAAMASLGPAATIVVTAIAGVMAAQQEAGRISTMEANREIENLRSLAQHYREGGRASAAYWLEQKANALEASTAISTATSSIEDLIARSAQFTRTRGYSLGSDPNYIKYMADLAAANEAAVRMSHMEEDIVAYREFNYRIQVDADTGPAQTQVSWLQGVINNLKAIIGIDADTSQAQSAASALASSIESMSPTMTVSLAGGGGGWSPPSEQQGTPYIPRTGPYFLHKGEAVIPASRNMSSHMTNNLNIYNNLDAELFLTKMEQRIVSAYRKTVG